MATVDILLQRSCRVYQEEELISGVVLLNCKSEFKHEGITLTMEGLLNLHLSPKSSGLIDTFVSSSKTTTLTFSSIELLKPGKLCAGETEIPFELPLFAKKNKFIHETYRGIYINIQYTLKCDVKRSILTKDICKPNYSKCTEKQMHDFRISPQTLKNARERSRVPNFLISGHFDSSQWSLSEPVTGELIIEECEKGINSICLHLIRLETCGSNENASTEVSEIQTTQIVDGDVSRGIAIPIYMVLPQLFTCATCTAPNFQIEYEINLMVTFENDYTITETFPVMLTRH